MTYTIVTNKKGTKHDGKLCDFFLTIMKVALVMIMMMMTTRMVLTVEAVTIIGR